MPAVTANYVSCSGSPGQLQRAVQRNYYDAGRFLLGWPDHWADNRHSRGLVLLAKSAGCFIPGIPGIFACTISSYHIMSDSFSVHMQILNILWPLGKAPAFMERYLLRLSFWNLLLCNSLHSSTGQSDNMLIQVSELLCAVSHAILLLEGDM